MVKRLFSFAVMVFFLSSMPVWAENEFKLKNPDINKYEFARSYINALRYFKHIDERWYQKPPKKIYPKDDQKVIKLSIDYLTWDNADLRIAKNYMIPYLSSPNALIRKVADTVIAACDEEIIINNQHKEIWRQWDYLKKDGKATSQNEKEFIKSHREYGLRLKEVDKQIIQASILTTKVLLSQENADEDGHLLAITSKEREKLVQKLDSYGKEMIAWGIKPGQRTLEASVAVIREVLEDSIWISFDEK